MAKVGSSAKFGVVVCKAFILDSPRGPSAKEGSSANYEHASKFTLASQRSFYERPKRKKNSEHPPRITEDLDIYPFDQDINGYLAENFPHE